MNNCKDTELDGIIVHPMPDVRCYTVEDLMAMLCLSRPTVYRLLKQNEFRWFKVGGAYRISKASFDAWLNEGVSESNLAS